MMLFVPPPFMRSGINETVASIVRADTAVSTADGTSHTFSAKALGAAATTRKIVIAVVATGTVNFGDVSVTLDGNAVPVRSRQGGGTRTIAAVHSVAWPTGATGDIVVTGSNTITSCAIVVYAVYGPIQLQAYDSGSDSSGDPMSLTLDTLSAGLMVGIAGGDTTAAFNPVSWTNITEDIDAAMESLAGYSSAFDLTPSGSTGLTITIDHGGATKLASVVASFAPAPATTPVLTFIGTTTDTTNAAVATFTNHAIGTASSDRFVVVAAYHASTSSRTMTCTIGGNAATALVTLDSGGSTPGRVTLFGLTVTTGTTATIVLTSTGTPTAHAVSVYTVTGLDSTTPIFTGSQYINTDSKLQIDPVTAKAGGVLIVAAIKATSNLTTSSELTEDVDAVLEGSISYYAGSATGIPAQTTDANDFSRYSADWSTSVKVVYVAAVLK